MSAPSPFACCSPSLAVGDVVDADAVVEMIAEQNDRDDPWEGPVPAHVLRFARYRCDLLRIEDADLEGHGYDPVLAADYAGTPADRFPPVVHDPLARTPIDGYHRIHAAILRGETTIVALIGIAAEEDPEWTTP